MIDLSLKLCVVDIKRLPIHRESFPVARVPSMRHGKNTADSKVRISGGEGRDLKFKKDMERKKNRNKMDMLIDVVITMPF